LNRRHQDTIAFFKNEVSVILETLGQQQRLLNSSQTLDRDHYATEHNPAIQRSRSRSRSYAFGSAHANYGSSYLAPEEPSASHSRYRSRSTSRPRSYYPDMDPVYYSGPSHLRSSDDPGYSFEGPKLDPTDPRGVQGLLTQDSQAVTDRKIRAFQEMNIRASELEKWVSFLHHLSSDD